MTSFVPLRGLHPELAELISSGLINAQLFRRFDVYSKQMKYFTWLTALALIFASVGCSKHSEKAVATLPVVQDLGVIKVSDGVPSRHDLGNDKVCIIDPSIQKDGTVMLDMRIEESGKILSRPRVQTTPGQPVEISVGNIEVKFTPSLKQ